MRILITHPFPVDDGPTGQSVRNLAAALLGAGHDVHLLVVACPDSAADTALVVRTVTCGPGDPAADLDFGTPGFETPGFEPDAPGRQTFAALSEDQLARYREAVRQKLDREVEAFDPHVIQVEYVWLLGQLVLETGVPYVARVWGPELTSCLDLPRMRGLAQQAAENAGRIIVADRAGRRGAQRVRRRSRSHRRAAAGRSGGRTFRRALSHGARRALRPPAGRMTALDPFKTTASAPTRAAAGGTGCCPKAAAFRPERACGQILRKSGGSRRRRVRRRACGGRTGYGSSVRRGSSGSALQRARPGAARCAPASR